MTWLLRAVLQGLISWATSVALDYSFGRDDLVRLTRLAIEEARSHQQLAGLSSADRQLIGRVEQRLLSVERIIGDYSLHDRDVASRLRLLESELRSIARQLEELDEKLIRVEIEQRRQLRLIVDSQGQIVRLQGQIVDAQGQVINLTSRVEALEGAVYPDPRRFLRHEAYWSLELLYTGSPADASRGEIGAATNFQYNLTRRLGLGGTFYFFPLYAETVSNPDSAAVPRSVDLYWTNFGGAGGPIINVLPAHSPVSLQLGGGLVFMMSYLAATGEDEGFWFSEYWERDTRWIPNFGYSLSGRLGFAPPAYGLEGLVTVGVIDLFKDFHTVNLVSATVPQPKVWYLGLGLRFRSFRR